MLPPDPILNLPILFAADPRPYKINLGIGVYHNNDGKSVLFSSVKEAEAAIVVNGNAKNYLPIDGESHFLKATLELIYGTELLKSLEGKIYCAQSVGGTSALRSGADFLLTETSNKIFISDPSWPTHQLIFKRSGFEVALYDYYDQKNCCLNFDAMCQWIRNMPSGSVILLHANCHNPTGVDPTHEEWKELSEIIRKQKVIPFFDFAYQGFGSSVDEDAWAIRYFAAQGHEMLVANSFSKNFGLYGERVGSISVICDNKEAIPKISSQLKQLIRATYSNPPRHGANIVSQILSTPSLKCLWLDELAEMRDRIKKMRIAFADGLEMNDAHRRWDFIRQQKGFFSFLGLSYEQVQRLRTDHAVIMPDNGRINMAGLNSHNLQDVINAVNHITRS